MARPKSRHGGRVTLKGTRPNPRGGLPRLDPETRYGLEFLEASAAELARRCSGADEADAWASVVQDFVAFPRTPDGLQPALLLAHARETGGTAGAALTSALAAYGPKRSQTAARRQLEEMKLSGEVPPWAAEMGCATPVEAFLRRDEWGEGCEITIHYQRPGGSLHGLLVDINWFMCGAARGFDLVSERDLAIWPADLEPDERGRTAVEPVSLADARALCLRSLHIYKALISNDELEMLEDGLDFEGMHLGFLAGHRLELLPEGGTDAALFPAEPLDRSVALEEFRRASRPAVEGDDELSSLISGLQVFASLCRDGDVLHWNPCRVDAFMEGFVANYSPADVPVRPEFDESRPEVFDRAFMSTVTSAFPRWLRFVAEHCEPSNEHLEENLCAAAEGFADWRIAVREYEWTQIGAPELWLPRSA